MTVTPPALSAARCRGGRTRHLDLDFSSSPQRPEPTVPARGHREAPRAFRRSELPSLVSRGSRRVSYRRREGPGWQMRVGGLQGPGRRNSNEKPRTNSQPLCRWKSQLGPSDGPSSAPSYSAIPRGLWAVPEQPDYTVEPQANWAVQRGGQVWRSIGCGSGIASCCTRRSPARSGRRKRSRRKSGRCSRRWGHEKIAEGAVTFRGGCF